MSPREASGHEIWVNNDLIQRRPDLFSYEKHRCPEPENRQCQRAQQVQQCRAQRHGIALKLEHAHHLGAEAGKRRQRAQKAGHQRQPPHRVELGQVVEHRDTDAHQIAADQVGGQRAPGKQFVGRTEPQVQAPAQECADAGAQADGDHLQHGGFWKLTGQYKP